MTAKISEPSEVNNITVDYDYVLVFFVLLWIYCAICDPKSFTNITMRDVLLMFVLILAQLGILLLILQIDDDARKL